MANIYDKIFVFIFLIVIFCGLFFTILSKKTINYAENRVANVLPNISYEEIINKNYQDKVSLAFEDQIPLSSSLKKVYNIANSRFQYKLSKILTKKYCNNNYIKVKGNINTFGCDNYLVYDYMKLEENKDAYDSRINNINYVIENSDADVYVYYIEKDTDIDFKTNEKTDIADYLFSNIKTDKKEKFLISNFDDYKNKFYKTDHHWNNEGSYQAYIGITKMMTNEEPLTIQSKKCISDHFSGSKAFFAGASSTYKENFCVYLYNFPSYETLINRKILNYGNESYYLSGNVDDLSYGSYYGNDDGEVIINTNDENKPNLLIIGSSYDNAIAKLIASHYNKTFIIDLRNYQRDLNEKFNYKEYIKINEIDKVLLIGDNNYFSSPEFDVED